MDVYFPGGESWYYDTAVTCVLVIIDVFSGFVVLSPLQSTSKAETQSVLRAFCHRFGSPRVVQSDLGSEFSGLEEALDDMFKLSGAVIEHRSSRPNNPRTNGRAEGDSGCSAPCKQVLL